MDVIFQGQRPLVSDPDPEKARAFFHEKSRALTSKVMTAKEAVTRFVKKGDYLIIGAFGAVRIPTAILHELIRQRVTGLKFGGHTATHDCQLLAAGRCFDHCDVAYVVGLEARGLSPQARRHMQSGDVQLTQWTNAALAWRLKAAAMGVPFLPARHMLGTDTLRYSGAKVVTCPYTGLPLVLLPALYPDLAFIHVHEADIYGNCRIRGIKVADEDLARASRKVIVTCERLISNEEIRNQPGLTNIPYYCVDAVVEVPYGSYPGNMPGEYFSDEDHLKLWLKMEKDPKDLEAFLEEYIFATGDFQGYLEKCGGTERLRLLRHQELLIDTGTQDERR
ncbi:MAG: CoA-transferase [Polyangia bacterium]|jgi:glutaconate CoA-transferase subunit A|nr:CoA-transferase [Polyangia bacterium]